MYFVRRFVPAGCSHAETETSGDAGPCPRADARLDVGVAGTAPVQPAVEKTSGEDLLRAELIVAPVTLVPVFGSAVAAPLPPFVELISVMSATAVLRPLSEVTEVSVFAMNVTVAPGPGPAIDDSLFVVGRFRDGPEAVRTAGRRRCSRRSPWRCRRRPCRRSPCTSSVRSPTAVSRWWCSPRCRRCSGIG
ncbi:MMPL family transporter [Rhizohabitans arisaemae]|uniref:MMPL family transporter n=1 Tax=Rhizohabitans arisaemae TaxID=2720610 RepID=UPI0024B11E09|nr:MMPL family transporter [Rhizohabitans arisaemae]